MIFISKVFLDFSNRFGFVHLTSSPHYTQGNREAERAIQTIKNLSKKASDPYIALLNYRSTPLQHGKSPAELFMNRKLHTRIPTISAKYTFCQHNAKKYKSIDAKIKERQKMDFDKQHQAKERSPFVEEQDKHTKNYTR